MSQVTLNPATDITVTNRRSLADFKKESGSESIDIIANPHKPGQLFFLCGKTYGKVSNQVAESINSVAEADLQVADMSILGQPAFPVLMMVGNSRKNVVRTL